MSTDQAVTVDVVDHVATVEIHRPPHNWFDLAVLDDARRRGPRARRRPRVPGHRAVLRGQELLRRRGPQRLRPHRAHRPALRAGRAPLLQREADRRRGAGRRGGWWPRVRRSPPTSASPPPRRASAATSPSSGSTRASASRSRCPRSIGQQRALELMYTGGDVRGDDALAIGLADRVVPADDLRAAALAFAAEIAESGPLAVLSIRETMRGDLADRVRAATRREHAEQQRLRTTDDFAEGIAGHLRASPAPVHRAVVVDADACRSGSTSTPSRPGPREALPALRGAVPGRRHRRRAVQHHRADRRTRPGRSSCSGVRRSTACCPPRTTWVASTGSSARSDRRPCPSPSRSRRAPIPT